ncbi:hypothetical protein GCM10009665_42540 [Kitasatospora nipponensis]|uniref:AB hydrolase-1 domain-containing protein n=1 Tax=Kitasatospora nipponensis TaxID=258049 RepID=A0ABP4H660_9ACTN
MTTDRPVHVTVWREGSGGPAAAAPVVLVHGTMSWGTDSFDAQRPLAARFELHLPDRRGYGASADTERSDYDVDAADVLELLDRLGGGAHLVGYSYGGVVAMLVAGLRPAAVRSLALIEPAAFRAADRDPVVAAALERIRAFSREVPRELGPREYLRASTEPYGLAMPEPTGRRLRAVRTAAGERPAWDAEVPLEPLVAGRYPKLVVNGDWRGAHPEYRALTGEAMMATGAYLARRIGARHLRVPGADHAPHRDGAEQVNRELAALWSPPAAGSPAAR